MSTLLLVAVLQQAAITPAVSPIACPVWEREHAFAASVRRHDHAAFAAHLDADAVFNVDAKQPLRGQALIAQRWKGIVDGTAMRLDWYPERVVAAATGDLAWSTGPALTEVPDGKGGWAPSLSRYQSVWRRGADGEWRVVFDTGSEPVPATPAQVRAFRAARTRSCDAD